jgi:DNA modification methylase
MTMSIKKSHLIQTRLSLGETETAFHARLKFPRLNSVNNPESIHGIYPYRGKISPIDAASIISQLPHNGVLLDPFCGTGTIVYEAMKWGLKAIGVDNNPLAITIAKGKVERIDIARVLHHVNEIIRRAKEMPSVPQMPEDAAKYFHKSTAEQIMRIHNFINEMSFFEKAAFYGAIALAARGCNHYKWSSTSIGKIITPHRYIDFYSMFYNKVRKHAKPASGSFPAEIFQHDARRLTEIIPENSIDFVYTSPPYFDALDYTGYYTKIIYAIEGLDRRKIREGLIQKITTYEEDMRKVLNEIDKVTKEDALIIFVVGDKKIHNKLIKGGEFFTNLSEWKPSYIIEREYTGTSSQIWDSINKTKRKEQIIVWDKKKLN